MVFRADDAHIHFLLVVQLMQQHFRGGTGCDDHGFAFQVGEIFDVAAFFHQQARADNENGVGERRLFLALEVIGGRTALEVVGAVLQQRNTVLRGDRDHLNLQIRLVQLRFNRLDDGVGVSLRIAHDFLLVVVIRKRNR